MTMHMIVGNQLITYSIVRRVSRRMRMLVHYCLTLVGEIQRDDEIIDRLFCVVYCRPSVNGYGTLADACKAIAVVATVVMVVRAVVSTLLQAILRCTSRQLMA